MFIRATVLSMMTALLVACGGGGGSAGSSGSTGSSTTTGTTTSTTTASVVADFQLGFNKNSINNNGSDEVTLNLVAVDQNNNVARGESVQITVDSQAIFNASENVTNSDGLFTGKITSPTNKNNRVIM